MAAKNRFDLGGFYPHAAQLDLIRLYLTQYLERAVLAHDANRGLLLGRVAKLRTTHEIEEFADQLAEFGAEVF